MTELTPRIIESTLRQYVKRFGESEKDITLSMSPSMARAFDRCLDPIRITILDDFPVLSERVKYRFGTFSINVDADVDEGEVLVDGIPISWVEA